MAKIRKRDQPPAESPVPAPLTTFAEMHLGPAMLHAIEELGYETPTPIQSETITIMMEGRDVIAQAPTGTGKTAAFGIPIVEKTETSLLRPQSLVVVPTRELAIQVSEAIFRLGKYGEVLVVPIYGGQPIDRQLRALRGGVQVVVGTPGRILDHLGRETLDLSHVRIVVLDEADEMLDMGFIEDIESILEQVPTDHQTSLFSATIPPRIAALANKYMRNPVRVSVAKEQRTVPSITQVYYEVPGNDKLRALTRILDLETPESTIIFVRTKRDADMLSEQLEAEGYLAQPIHGDLNQAQRERTLRRFRDGQIEILVATDVASRGLDIPAVSHVINYDTPIDTDAYIHRIGRTGRAGRSGQAITLVTPRERRHLRMLENALRSRIKPMQVPTNEAIAARRREEFKENLMHILDAGELDPYLNLVEDLTESYDPAEIAAAAFKMISALREPQRTTKPAEDGTGSEPGMIRIFINIGRRAGVRPADLVGAIANEARIRGDQIGAIDIYDNFSFVEVPRDTAERVLQALNRTTIRSKPVEASIARPKEVGPAA